MIVFWVICAILLAIALTFILPPLLQPHPLADRDGMKEANVAVYRERLAQMELDLREGTLAKEQFVLDREELEHGLIEDLPTSTPARRVARSSLGTRVVPFAVAAGLPAIAVFVYLKLGNPQMLSSAVTQMPTDVRSALEEARNEPGNFDAQVKAAELYYQIQRYDEARDLLLKANQLEPDDVATLVNLGLVNTEGGHLDDAEKWYRLALTRQPDDTRVLVDYCTVLIMQAKSAEAQEVIRRLTRIDPANRDLPRLRSSILGAKDLPR